MLRSRGLSQKPLSRYVSRHVGECARQERARERERARSWVSCMSFLHLLIFLLHFFFALFYFSIKAAARRTLLPLFRGGLYDAVSEIGWSSLDAADIGSKANLKVRDDAALYGPRYDS